MTHLMLKRKYESYVWLLERASQDLSYIEEVESFYPRMWHPYKVKPLLHVIGDRLNHMPAQEFEQD